MNSSHWNRKMNHQMAAKVLENFERCTGLWLTSGVIPVADDRLDFTNTGVVKRHGQASHKNKRGFNCFSHLVNVMLRQSDVTSLLLMQYVYF